MMATNSEEPGNLAPVSADQPKQLAYKNPEEWFIDFLSPTIRRKLGGSHTWCSRWWEHGEAISRMYAMWMAWEHLRYEGPLGVSTWWIHHGDPHLAVLLSKDGGPFAACRPDRHTMMEKLPFEPAPPATWGSSSYTDPAAA